MTNISENKTFIQPLWSIMIPTYKSNRYIKKTLNSVLTQVHSFKKMQIEVIDDCSHDNFTKNYIQTIKNYPISFYEQKENVGATKNFNTCIKRAKGEFIHILHGDDTVNNGFYIKVENAFKQYPDIGAVFCRQNFIDENDNLITISKEEQNDDGIMNNILLRLTEYNCIQPPSIVVKKEVYEKVGGFNEDLIHAADWEMWFRIALNFKIWYINKPLVNYRVHSESDTSDLIKDGRNIKDIKKAIIIIEDHLRKHKKYELITKLRYNAVIVNLNKLKNMLSKNDLPLINIQIKKLLEIYFNITILIKILHIYIKFFINKLK